MMILGTFEKRALTMCAALCVLCAGWAYADDFTETLENVGKSYGSGNVPETRLYVQDLLKIRRRRAVRWRRVRRAHAQYATGRCSGRRREDTRERRG